MVATVSSLFQIVIFFAHLNPYLCGLSLLLLDLAEPLLDVVPALALVHGDGGGDDPITPILPALER